MIGDTKGPASTADPAAGPHRPGPSTAVPEPPEVGPEGEEDDLLIVGAGPCGLACGAAAQQAGLRYRVIEKGAIVNSLAHFPLQISFFSTSDRLSIAGVPFVTERANPTRREALDYYRAVVDHLRLRVQTFERVVDVQRDGDGFRVWTRPNRRLAGGWAPLPGEPAPAPEWDGMGGGAVAAEPASAGEGLRVYRARNIVLATGYFDQPNRLGVPGEDLPHVAHYYREGHAFYGQRVLVVGGQNSAVEAALDLHRCGAKVTLVHRGPVLSQRIKPWVLPSFQSLVDKGRIAVWLNTVVCSIHPGGAELDVAGERRWLPCDFVFALVGYRPDHSLVRRLGVPINPATGEPEHDPETMATPVPGVYLAGVVAAGYDANKIFIENGREHGARIVAHILAHRSRPRRAAG